MKDKLSKARRVVTATLAVALMCSLAGCKKEEGPTREELLAMNESYANQVGDMNEQIAEMQSALDKLSGTKNTVAGAIVDMETGSGRTFNPLAGSIDLPIEVKYPESEAAPAASRVQLDGKYTIEPGNNWTITLDGTQSSFYHNSGITVKIQVSKIKQRVQATDLREKMFDPITSAIPCENAKYGTIFYNEAALGGTASFTTSVGDQPAQMQLGAFGDNDRCFVYMTLYEGDVDSTKEELVSKLLSSITYGSRLITFS